MFGLNKKSDSPPDVGEEDKYEETGKEADGDKSTSEPELSEGVPIAQKAAPLESSSVGDSQMNIRIEQLDAKLDTVTNWMKQVYERFSYISESIGEMRSMNLNNEKQIVKAIKDSAQASELVNDVQPQELRMDSKKTNLRIDLLDEKIEANKQFVDSVMEQFKEIQRKAEVFIGTEGVLKLNEDTKKELIEIQKLASRARLDADKSEQIFMELKRALSEMQSMSSEFASFNNTSDMIKKDIEKIKVDHSKVVGDEEFADLKKIVDRKFKTIDVYVGAIEGIKESNVGAIDLTEKILRMTKANKENIGSLALAIGKDNIKRVSDYEMQMDGMLKLIDSLAGQISEIKGQIGMKPKISIIKHDEPLVHKNKIKMQHINVPRHIVRQIVPKKKKVISKVVASIVVAKKGSKKVVSSAVKSDSSSGETVKKLVEVKEEYLVDKEIAVLQERIAKLNSEI